MPYRISGADIAVLSMPERPGWQRTSIPDTLGEGYVDRMKLAGGLSIAYSCYTPIRDLIEESLVDRETRALTITIAQDGRSIYRGKDGSGFTFLAGHTTATLFGRMHGERRYLANETVRQWRLIVDESALRTYALDPLLDHRQTGAGAQQLLFAPTNDMVNHWASRLTHLYDSTAGVLDLQIAALTVLAEQSRQLFPSLPPSGLKTNEQSKATQARDLMLRHYDRALSMPYLCAAVGTNEFTLKQGFQECFGTSPHRMLVDIRMRKAWELLESGEQVARVAYRVGFQHPSSFSAAFQRYYGRAPKSLKPTGRSPG